MTEKRFEEYDNGFEDKIKNEYFETNKEIVDRLNALHEENQELRYILCYTGEDEEYYLRLLEKREDAVNLLNKLQEENEHLKKENKELRQDNDIKFWKHQFMTQHNRIQLILHELSLAMNEGYEVSDKFKEWLGDLREKNKEVITKHERLFE